MLQESLGTRRRHRNLLLFVGAILLVPDMLVAQFANGFLVFIGCFVLHIGELTLRTICSSSSAPAPRIRGPFDCV